MNDKVKYGFIDRTGEIHITNEGYSIKITECINSKNCTVLFEDGTTITKRDYSNIKNGKVKKPEESMNYTGEGHITKQGYKIKITEGYDKKRCTVQFENGVVLKNIHYNSIILGTLLNPYHPTVYGIGYLGVGQYKGQTDKVRSKIYNAWKKILERAYSEKLHLRKPTYKGVTVCDEWCNFQIFAEWVESNYKTYMKDWQLDKDILIKGNKIYSPEMCRFVPPTVNNLFTSRILKRGKYPIGVTKSGNRYQASLSKGSETIPLGTYDTPEEAFQVYKTAKEKYIKEVADEWKEKLDPKTYRAMYNWKVEITD